MVPKFRAYLKDKKQILPVCNMEWGYEREIEKIQLFMVMVIDQNLQQIWEYPKDIELMQWTGLVDKNGVEVFEGDIVKYHEQISSDNELQREIQGADLVVLDDIGFIEWDDEGADFSIVLKSGDVRGFFTRGEQDFEVIGNRYLNPELLEGRWL